MSLILCAAAFATVTSFVTGMVLSHLERNDQEPRHPFQRVFYAHWIVTFIAYCAFIRN